MTANFKDDSPKAIRFQPRMWFKGLLRLGHDVQRFSYGDVLRQVSPFPSKRFAETFARKTTDRLLCEQIENYGPDVVFVYSMKTLDARAVSLMRQAAPKAVFVGRDEDPFPEANRPRLAIAAQLDVVVNTSAGRFLQTYKDAGVKCCAFLPDLCDPDIQYRYEVDARWRCDLIFTGKPEHTRLDRNNERYNLVKAISEYPGARVYGAFGIPRVEGIDYFRAISGARIGVNINAANDVRLYHSDRLMNYVACGAFTLARRVPEADLLFEDGVHVKYFDTAEECFELVRWYLAHEGPREQIAAAGMARAHAEFNCRRQAARMMDILDKGRYDAPYCVVL
ncbi:MAG TPA: hypothetical protein ENN81_06080 [Phycisphaerales bacterium]|nr:hypothetical protein [Phycisphaerales bacterium]